jgi:hypothetical protein
LKKRCDFIISAFGSTLRDPDVKAAMEELKFDKYGGPEVDKVSKMNEYYSSN